MKLHEKIAQVETFSKPRCAIISRQYLNIRQSTDHLDALIEVNRKLDYINATKRFCTQHSIRCEMYDTKYDLLLAREGYADKISYGVGGNLKRKAEKYKGHQHIIDKAISHMKVQIKQQKQWIAHLEQEVV